MIGTVTPNPALDVTYELVGLDRGGDNRVARVVTRAGGKGVNTAAVLVCLGDPVTALGPLGGQTGGELRRQLELTGIYPRFTTIAGDTRRTVAIVETAGGATTMLNEPGPALSALEWAELRAEVARLAAEVSVLTMSGSLPTGVGVDAYAELVGAARERSECLVVVDTSGPALPAAATARPDLMKPNAAELAAVYPGVTPGDRPRRLLEAGAGAVAVSSGRDGLRLVTTELDLTARLPEPLTGNPTGAGDAVVAAFAHELAAHGRQSLTDPVLADRAARYAVAVSAASVLAPVAGVVQQADVDRMLARVTSGPTDPQGRAR